MIYNYLLIPTEQGDVILYWRIYRVPLGDCNIMSLNSELWCGVGFGWKPLMSFKHGFASGGEKYKSERLGMAALRRLRERDMAKWLRKWRLTQSVNKRAKYRDFPGVA